LLQIKIEFYNSLQTPPFEENKTINPASKTIACFNFYEGFQSNIPSMFFVLFLQMSLPTIHLLHLHCSQTIQKVYIHDLFVCHLYQFCISFSLGLGQSHNKSIYYSVRLGFDFETWICTYKFGVLVVDCGYFPLNPFLYLHLDYIISLNFPCTLELVKKFVWVVVGGCVNLF
jgi:hypothetical protein